MKRYPACLSLDLCCGRAPSGARGLKHRLTAFVLDNFQSRPFGGAWIETRSRLALIAEARVAPLRGRVD